MKVFYFFILFLCTFFTLRAQTPFLHPHQLFKGREDYTVSRIYQDPKGWIWFGTDKGLFRFDGINYTRFTTSEGLAEDQITAIYTVAENSMWIGHKNGEITIYDGNSFKVFTPEEGLGKVEITDIVSDSSGIIWYSTLGEGVFKYDGRYLTNMNTDDGVSDNNVYDLEVDYKGVLWLATDNGITRFSSKACDIISMKDGLNDNIVRVLEAAPDGNLWVGTEEQGISIYSPDNKSFTNLSGWNFGPITGFTMPLLNDIWISTEKEGIIQLQISENSKPTYRKLTTDQGLISNRIKTILKDDEDNIWIGGKYGIIQALPPVFEFLNESNGTPFKMAYSLIKDNDENLWVCSESGLYRGIPDNSGQFIWDNLSKIMGLRKMNFISLFPDNKGQVWAGTYGEGVFKIEPKNLRYSKIDVSNGLCDNNVISVSGKDSLVWFSTLGGGVSCYNIYQSKLLNFRDTLLNNSYVYSSKPDNYGRTWIAGSMRLPAYIFHDSLKLINYDSLKFTQLYSVALDSSDGVWFNTGDKGLFCFKDNKIELFGEAEGINSNKIQSIVFDKFDNLLIISNGGLLFYKPNNGVIQEFGENSGLSYKYPLLNSVFTDKKDQIWIGTETGIIKYNPDYLAFTNQKPRVFLSVKNLFYNPIQTEKSKFSHDENNFTFGYTGIWFRNPEGLNYRYMLEGNDLKWNFANRSQNLTYSQLTPGTYTFKVEVSLDSKNWYNSDDSQFRFSISAPFWQRWWFILAIIVIFITGVLLYIKLRLSFLEKAKKELEEEVHKRTEEIMNKNEELESQKEEIETQRDHAEEQRDKIEVQKEEIQASIRYAYRIQTATLPPKNQLDSVLKNYFILNKPRDIVSGDFFWVAKNGNKIFFAVGDCTGHGVPGAFMSMLGLSALNDIVKSLNSCKASIILNLLRDRILESLHQFGERELISNDGMDISLCILNTETNQLQFAAAHNPLYLIRNSELIVINADKVDIGSFSIEKQEFTNQEIQCEVNDQLYLFSDGFADQFGGPLGKKYKYQKFKEFLVSIHSESMQKQKWLLDQEIEEWKGSYPQVDDILLMGVRI